LGQPNSKTFLKEDDMNVPETETKPATKHSVAGDPWMQITFTIDTEHYRALRDRAEAEDLTVPGFVRKSVIDSLEAAGRK